MAHCSLEPGGTPGRRKIWWTGDRKSTVLTFDPTQPEGSRWGEIGSPCITSGQVWGILADRRGTKWFGHCCVGPNLMIGGTDTLNDQSATPQCGLIEPTQFNDTPHNSLVIGQDPIGNIWFGSGDDNDGLYEYTTAGQFQHFSTSNPPPGCQLVSNVIASMAFQGYDKWIGAFQTGGLVRCHDEPGNQFSTVYTKDVGEFSPRFIPGNGVRGMAISGDSMWVGTSEGLAIIRISADVATRSFTTLDGSIPSNSVGAVARGPNGDIWVGTSGGLTLVRGGNFTTYTTDNSLLVWNDVKALCADGTGSRYSLWIGTANGISRLDVGASDTTVTGGATQTLRFYPHPFRPGGGRLLKLNGDFGGPANVRIFDARGRLVREFPAVASDQAFWDGTDEGGRAVGAGIYRVRVEADGVVSRMVLAVIR